MTLALNVPNCNQGQATIRFYEQDGSLDPTTLTKICHTDDELVLQWACVDTDIISEYEHCNDPLYKQDAVLIFLATEGSYPHNYFEFEVSPKGQLFFADITNTYGNCSEFSGRPYPCDPIIYSARIL